jgi:hypothetical protein
MLARSHCWDLARPDGFFEAAGHLARWIRGSRQPLCAMWSCGRLGGQMCRGAWLGKEGQVARLRKELWGEADDFSFSGSTISYENVFCIDEP